MSNTGLKISSFLCCRNSAPLCIWLSTCFLFFIALSLSFLHTHTHTHTHSFSRHLQAFLLTHSPSNVPNPLSHSHFLSNTHTHTTYTQRLTRTTFFTHSPLPIRLTHSHFLSNTHNTLFYTYKLFHTYSPFLSLSHAHTLTFSLFWQYLSRFCAKSHSFSFEEDDKVDFTQTKLSRK